jgi:hypothetical protein
MIKARDKVTVMVRYRVLVTFMVKLRYSAMT